MINRGKQFTITRTFEASRGEVWRAWTDVDVAARWWHPAGMETRPETVRIDLREGGTFTYTMVDPDGTEHPWAGTYLAVRPVEHLRFTWGADDPGADSLVITVDLAETDTGKTIMTFHVDGVDGRPGDDDVYNGWEEAFAFLDQQLR